MAINGNQYMANYKQPTLGLEQSAVEAGKAAAQAAGVAPEQSNLDADWYRKKAEKYASMRWGEGITPTQTSPEIARFAGGEKEFGKGGAAPFLSRTVDFATAFTSAFDKAVATKQANALANIPKGDIDEKRQQMKDDSANFKWINKDFQNKPIVKDRNLASDAYQGMKALANQETKAAGIAMIFKFMKGLDPSSVVRESEYALAAGAGDILEKLAGYIQNLKGGNLPEGVQDDFLKASKVYLNALENHYQQELNTTKKIGKQFGLSDEAVQLFDSYVLPANVETSKPPKNKPTEKPKTLTDDERLKAAARKGDIDAQDILKAEGKKWD